MYLPQFAVYIHTFVYVYTVMFSLLTPRRRTLGGVIAPLILTSLDRDEFSASRTGHFTPEKEPRYPLNRMLVGSKSRSGRFGRKNNLLSLPEFLPQTVHPTANCLKNQSHPSPFTLVYERLPKCSREVVTLAKRERRQKENEDPHAGWYWLLTQMILVGLSRHIYTVKIRHKYRINITLHVEWQSL
jgi:hypothetical protein